MIHSNFYSANAEITAAYLFAETAHRRVGQVRKYTGEPYISHPIAVAELVRSVAPDDHAMIAAALLHDVVEDTGTTIEEIINTFDDDIAQLVAEVTNVSRPEDGNRSARKELNRQHLQRASSRGQSIKLADMLHNMLNLVEHDPAFAKVYLPEKICLMYDLRQGNRCLYVLVAKALAHNANLLASAKLIDETRVLSLIAMRT